MSYVVQKRGGAYEAPIRGVKIAIAAIEVSQLKDAEAVLIASVPRSGRHPVRFGNQAVVNPAEEADVPQTLKRRSTDEIRQKGIVTGDGSYVCRVLEIVPG